MIQNHTSTKSRFGSRPRSSRSGLLLGLLLFVNSGAQQNSGPWNSPLRQAWSNDGIAFETSTIFQDSAGVPSVIRAGGDTLIAAFQWFRGAQNSSGWDRIAIKKSFNGGIDWTQPVTATFVNYPNIVRAFDPALLQLPDGRIRMYFSSRPGKNAELDSTVDTYSATSTDGYTYVFDSINPVFGHPTKQVIDPTVAIFGGKIHLSAPIGVIQDGAYHNESSITDGLTFTASATYPSEIGRNWTGNYCVVDSTTLRFYGAGATGPWYKQSSDGVTWPGPYVNLGMPGGDPSTVRVRNGKFLMVYVGPPYSVSIQGGKEMRTTRHSARLDRMILELPTDAMKYRVLDVRGQPLRKGLRGSGLVVFNDIPFGIYLLEWTTTRQALHSARVIHARP